MSEAILTQNSQDGPSPMHTDPMQRLAYWAALAQTVIERGTHTGLLFSVETALRDAWYDGVFEGVARLGATQRRIMAPPADPLPVRAEQAS